jgi:hypothetical protein
MEASLQPEPSPERYTMKAVVSFSHLTMGKLFLRSASPERLAAMSTPTGETPLSHWTLREPTGALIIDVHADEDSFRRDFARNWEMFSAPVHNFRADAYSFVDEEHEAAAIDAFARSEAAVSSAPSGLDPSMAQGDLKGRVISLNHLPRLPEPARADVRKAIAAHTFKSVVHLALRTPQGELLVDPYLAEPDLIDDFVFVDRLLADAGVRLVNHWHMFTDRAHERALDHLALGLGVLEEPSP